MGDYLSRDELSVWFRVLTIFLTILCVYVVPSLQWQPVSSNFQADLHYRHF